MVPNKQCPPSGADPQAHLEAIIYSSNDAIITKTLDGRITSWNPAAERIFGYSVAEAVGQPMLFCIPPDLHAEEAAILARIARGERVNPFETVRVRRDGSLVDVSVSLSPIRDSAGKVVGASKIARDISERKKVDDRFGAMVDELRDIRAALDEHSIVAITDSGGRITYVNDQFCSISQYSRAQLMGQDHRIISSGLHPKGFFRDLWKIIGSGRTWRGEICNRARDGSLYWVDTTIFPRLDPAGKPTQYVAIRTDITQRKANEAKLVRNAEDLAQKNKELETIVYTVSHDLRSPLINVQGFGKHLERACERIKTEMAAATNGMVPTAALAQPITEAIPQALRFISAGINKMDTLLAGLLRYSRLGREALVIETLEINVLVAEALAAMKFQLDLNHAEVQVGPLPACRGDKIQTSRVFTNVIDNAIKYRHPDRPLQLTITGQETDGQAIYTLADNGIGIAPEHQAKAFEIFHRLDPEHSVGDGLGLTIAQRVLERQHGTIRVKSTGMNGSAFIVTLPAGSAAQTSLL